MRRSTKAAGLPTVSARLSASGAIVMGEPAIRIDRHKGEALNNFRKRVARTARKHGFAIGAFENASGEALPDDNAPAASREGNGVCEVIYLGGAAPLRTALGPREFRVERRDGETEEAFRARALAEATRRNLSWIAFERPALPARAVSEEGA